MMTLGICLAYFLAVFFRVFEKIFGNQMTWHGLVAMFVGLMLHITSLVMAFQESAVAQVFQVLNVASAAGAVLVAACLFVEWRVQNAFFSQFVLPLVIPLVVVSAVQGPFLQGPNYQGMWFIIHVLSSVAGECFFFLAGVTGATYLFVARGLKKKNQLKAVRFFPPLTRLDELIFVFSAMGFCVFSVGMISGAFWSSQAFGVMRLFEAKRIFSLVLWGMFGILVFGRFFRGWAGQRIAMLAILGFFTSFTLIFAGGTQSHWTP